MDLIPYDVEKFLDKYTRFITKNIYIDEAMYQNFLKPYHYLYQALEKNTFLYSENSQYQKMTNIKHNQLKLRKLHNQKYLKNCEKNNQAFFDNLYPTEILDSKKRQIILLEEPRLLFINQNHTIPFVVAKIKYLLEQKQLSHRKIFVLTEKEATKQEIKQELSEKVGQKISVEFLDNYLEKQLKPLEKHLTENHQVALFNEYIMTKLFPSKERFNQLCQLFQAYIYLNSDYQDFDTFKDYHHYMYKRKLLASSLSLKKFNEQEINKRKKYLRTINNEIVKNGSEVDIANFLYLNSIPYQYTSESSFLITHHQKQIHIKFHQKNEPANKPSSDKKINLYEKYSTNTTYLEQLAYELISIRYPLELLSSKQIYERLRETTIDSYFHDWITKCLLPGFNYYQKHHHLTTTNLTLPQQKALEELYQDYQYQLTKQNFITETELVKRIEQNFQSNSYQYLILVGDIPLQLPIPSMNIIKEYPKVELLKENPQLFPQYKQYLQNHNSLPVSDIYPDEQELTRLTTNFLKENLSIINQNLSTMENQIIILFYEDSNRFQIPANITEACLQVVENILPEESLKIALNHLNNINLLLTKNTFLKNSHKKLLTPDQTEIFFDEILKLDQTNDNLLLPDLIENNSKRNLFAPEIYYSLKVKLYVALQHCRKNLYLLCPTSRKEDLPKILGTLKNIKNL